MCIEALLVRIQGSSYNNTDTYVVIMNWANYKHLCIPPKNPIDLACDWKINNAMGI